MIELIFIWLFATIMLAAALWMFSAVIWGNVMEKLLGFSVGLGLIVLGIGGGMDLTDNHFDKIECRDSGYAWVDATCYSELVEVNR